MEKAEILEHTVLFLRSSSSRGEQGPPQASTAQPQHSFQDGFSACLHRAAHFLEAEAKAPGLASALDAALATGSGPGLVSPRSWTSTLVRLKKTPQSLLRELKQRRTVAAPAETNYSQTHRGALRPRTAPLQSRTVECRVGKESQGQAPGPSLWRPWP